MIDSKNLLGPIVIIGLASLPISKWVNEYANITHLVLYEIIWWALIFLTIFYVKFIERRKLDSIGFKTITLKNGVVGLVAGLVITLVLALCYFEVFPALLLQEKDQVGQLMATPLWWRIISVIRAGMSEEIIFRGYGIERLTDITKNKYIASFLTLIVFAFAHVAPWSWNHAIIAGVGGLLFTILYLWKRNIWINVIAHIVVDGVAVLQ